MALRIEDYALIGDCKTAALVGRDGAIDWLCWPRFDSAACFAALLGTADNGRWLISPMRPGAASRRYRPGTLILESEFQTESGRATLVDFMALSDEANLVRIVVGQSGRVEFRTEFVARFNYGSTVPWVNRLEDGAINAIAGPERLVLRTPAELYGEDLRTLGEFGVEAGQAVPFVLSFGSSSQSLPPAIDAFETLERTEAYNCNAFVADIANFMGLKVPSSSWIYPKVFVSNMRKINTGHPEAANELVSDNVKEMSNPTRDGRAMIAAGLIHPDARSTTAPVSPAPNVTIGAVRVSNRPAGSSEHSP